MRIPDFTALDIDQTLNRKTTAALAMASNI
jgi:hypothetical protein